MSTGSRLVFPSFRRKPESRRFWNLNRKTNLDAGVRRHDELSLRLKARDFNHPDRDIKSTWAYLFIPQSVSQIFMKGIDEDVPPTKNNPCPPANQLKFRGSTSDPAGDFSSR